MKKNNTAKKAVLPALLAVLCSTAALTSVSYAWFTMGKEASVEQIEVNVDKADGLQVSADARNYSSWSDEISLTDLAAVRDDEQKVVNKLPTTETALAPVSSAGNVKNGVQEIFYAEDDKDDGLIGKVAEAGVDYLVFDLYLKVDSKKTLQLKTTSTVTAGQEAKDSELAARVSFVNLGHVGFEGSSYDGAAAFALTGEATDVAKIWEPNAVNHIDGVTPTVQNGAEPYAGITSLGDEVKNGLHATTTAAVTTFTNDSATAIAALEAGVNKLRVYIWLEGQDIDCTNAIAQGSFATSLGFDVIDRA